MSVDRITPELFLQVFEQDKRGAAILEYLIRRFSSAAVVPTATNGIGGIEAVLQTYHRLGATAVIQHIVDMINRAQGVPDQPEDEDEPQA